MEKSKNTLLSRREYLRLMGVSGIAAGLHTMGIRHAEGFESSIITEREVQANRFSPSLVNGKVIQPQRELSVLHTTDVLVIGGGPVGVCAAIAAKRAGADVTIVERYGALVPKKVDDLLVVGRCISAVMRMADLVRLIPNCFVTGHAAGVAAAVAIQDRCYPRDVEVAKVQRILKQQEAYLG